MEVILLEKIRNLGVLGELVKVKAGFARNYLLPQRKAVTATEANRTKFEAQRADLEKREAELLKSAEQRAEKINASGAVTITAKVAEEGKLYGSVGIYEVSEAIKKAGIDVQKSEIKMPAGPIRHIGEYEIQLFLHGDVTATIKVVVVPEPA
ncbi:MAG: 50S ribosomal protein L9 [Gammaproteobacteria bacterium]|nr:50S ribosomal protein L9 [Gammaproteobacteria bacterium]